MDLHKVKTIVQKEWAEVFKNRMVLFSVIFLPLIFTALPLVILFATRDVGVSELDTEMPAQFAQLCSAELTGGECFQVYMTSQMMLLFMMMPLIIPVNIAAYSIVGEKTTHSLEPLLATPITTGELVTGKNLSAVIPAVIATWLCFGLYAIGAMLIVPSGAPADSQGRAQYRLRTITTGGDMISKTFEPTAGIGDVYRIQFSLRYRFN